MNQRRRKARPRAFIAVVAACSLLVILGTARPPTVRAATPAPTEAIVGDTRSPGEGPGLVGAPFLAIGGVLGLGLAAAGLTLLYVRATGGSSRTGTSRFTPLDERRDRPEGAGRRR